MFTGIVKGVFPVAHIERLKDFIRLSVELNHELVDGVETGASIAVNGVCLTVMAINGTCVSFDVMKETLRATNLGNLTEGGLVNIERAARFGDEIGGHLLSGHIHDTVMVSSVIREPHNVTVSFSFDSRWRDYLLPKGYVALNGASLTIGEKVQESIFCVHLIPETLRLTTFGEVKEGDQINLEIDSQTQAVVDTVKNYMVSQA